VQSSFVTLILITLFHLSTAARAEAPPPPDQNWEVLNEEEGITVYRTREARKNIFTFRGVGLVEANIPKLLALMSDPRQMPQWVFNCQEGELVERNFKETDRSSDSSAYYQIFYAVTRVPWPLNPRDYVLKAQITYERQAHRHLPKSVTIAMRSVEHPTKPPVAGRVRMPLMESTIVMTPEGPDGKKTWVDFSVSSNPGGVIPPWISQIASREIPRKTLLNLRRMAQAQDYNRDFEALVQHHYSQELKR
jgi:hypothetical protein